jgi:hypothetical protein
MPITVGDIRLEGTLATYFPRVNRLRQGIAVFAYFVVQSKPACVPLPVDLVKRSA